ncbi:class I SAM-dependent methyltransferase [Methylobacterium gossipiicola]|uniref:Methyltransferase domain-containing protein n=1 Tax=Methylobacterium gossipiicola TaxID=582675 RepID=A0A1I2X8A6_9HYPH|nr:class I SAM-dependent methyltransferase [Methylobacterium gossipiicola]SFH09632.1 hypothetical protein SAMN05192565_13428 [Methylobacterium gossipiicola]
MIRELLTFYGNGEATFGSIIYKYLEAARIGRPSRLNEILCRHGSDKGTWHSYPLLYELLFESLPATPRSIFEIGIGTNNIQVVGNMGATGIPGASHRAWREYFPDAIIYGADHDIGCLFEEKNIHTFFIDQNDLTTIHRAWSVAPHLFFDLIVDDGAHNFEANTLMLDATYERVNPGGLYIIEDIVLSLSNLARFDAYFSNRGWDAFILRLPHADNFQDNAVAVVRPKPSVQGKVVSEIDLTESSQSIVSFDE